MNLQKSIPRMTPLFVGFIVWYLSMHMTFLICFNWSLRLFLKYSYRCRKKMNSSLWQLLSIDFIFIINYEDILSNKKLVQLKDRHPINFVINVEINKYGCKWFNRMFIGKFNIIRICLCVFTVYKIRCALFPCVPVRITVFNGRFIWYRLQLTL